MTVYFAQPTLGGQIKIGSTLDVANRMAVLGAWHPPHVEVIHEMPGLRVREYVIHRLLQRYRQQGEWFHSAPVVWRLILEAIDTGLPWLPEEPERDNSPSYGVELVQKLTKRFGSKSALSKASNLGPQSLGTATRGFGAPFGLMGTLVLSDMENAGVIPGYLEWQGLLGGEA